MNYVVQKIAVNRVRWVLLARPPEGAETVLGSYPTRRAALTVARLIAGRQDLISVQCEV